MNKVFIRTRQIDNNKQLPILLRENDDLTDFNEYSNISKSSQILSGMDKGEESEHHLQEVLRELQYEKTVSNTAIPIPEVAEEPTYEFLYKTDFKLHKHYIRLKTLDFEDELPEYDLDEEDKEWLENSKLNVTSLKFEQIIEQFEKACCQKALLLDEAKSLLRHEAVHLVIAIYDYWLTKRVNSGQTLILSVKAEKAERCNNTPIDPYIAFRKRSEKMTTRKNRRVDETSYEKMYRLRSQMEKLSEIIQLVSKREATKSQITQNERDIFMKRYDSRDYDKLQLKESEITIKRQSIKLGDNFKSAQRSREENQKETKRKRTYSKSFEPNQSSVEQQSEDIDFTFRPMSKCKYLPSRFAMDDSSSASATITTSNSHDFSNQLINCSKSFSLSKLSHLPENLQKLNIPVRLRINSNKMLAIDLQEFPTPDQRLWPSTNPDCSARFTADRRDMLHNNCRSSTKQYRKLFSLYNRNINCGLPPINYPSTHSSANNRHISSPYPPSISDIPATSNVVLYQCSPLSRSVKQLAGSQIRHNDQQRQTEHNSNHNHNDDVTHHHNGNNCRKNTNDRLYQQNHHHYQHLDRPISNNDNHYQLSSTNDNNCTTISKSSSSSLSSSSSSILPSSSSSSSSISHYNTNQNHRTKSHSSNNNNNNNKNSYHNNHLLYEHHSPLSSSLLLSATASPNAVATITPSSVFFLSNTNTPNTNTNNNVLYCHSTNNNNNSNGTTICTYQNNSYFNYSDNTNNRTNTSNNNTKNCAFIESDQLPNGQHRKTTATTRELVESHSNNRSSSSLNGGGGGGIKNQLSQVGLNCFKSLTNKRVIPRKDINEIASYYSKKSNGHHQHRHTSSWLKQNPSDSCLTPNLLPLWKSEPHVMTSVNKMT